ncbi:MAG: hypothetical protein R2749_15235 [Acidimicrobiales bacterium]
MELAPNHYACERCGITFPRRYRTGRRPHYCTRTCRQRAYEARRRGAEHHRLPTPELAFPPAADRPDHSPGPHCYEPGRGRRRIHALQPDGPPDRRNRRPTLCGTTARDLKQQRSFNRGPYSVPTCRTCSDIATRYPLAKPVQPPTELARIKHLLRNTRHRIARGDKLAQLLLIQRLYLLTS